MICGMFKGFSWLYPCDKSSYISFVYSQYHVDWLKCTEQNIKQSKSHASLATLGSRFLRQSDHGIICPLVVMVMWFACLMLQHSFVFEYQRLHVLFETIQTSLIDSRLKIQDSKWFIWLTNDTSSQYHIHNKINEFST